MPRGFRLLHVGGHVDLLRLAIDATVLSPRPTAVPLAIMVGLMLGKSFGIGRASWLAVTTGLAELPGGSAWRHLIGTAFLTGIGFTMALFISGLTLPARISSSRPNWPS